MFAEGYIGIAGTIGVGKSTLTMDLAQALNFEPILEEVDGNPYLEKFYTDMKGYGTMMQVWLLNHRFRQPHRWGLPTAGRQRHQDELDKFCIYILRASQEVCP